MMDMGYNRKLILEDGEEYYGFAFGYTGDKVLEIVFNTSMVGYQEILSDPSYTDQAVVMTYPLIGNYGMAADDYETKVPTIGAFIVREYNNEPSNFRSEKSLAEVMIQHQISGIYGVDTRKLTRSIRNKGSRKCLLTSADTSLELGLQMLSNTSIPKDAVSRVSCGSIWRSKDKYGKYHVVAIDCGMKMNIVRSLNARGCDVTIVPWNTSAEAIEALNPDGLFISNGAAIPPMFSRSLMRSAGCAASMQRHRTDDLRLKARAAGDGGYQNGRREQCAERTVQNRRAGEAAGTQKRSLAAAGGEGAGMVRIEW